MIQSTPDNPQPLHALDAQMIGDLWVFRAIATHQSFTAAAQQLGVTQGAVSQRMARLEKRLGIVAVVRERRQFRLSDAGQGLFEAMNQASKILSDALDRFDRAKRRSLVVSCVPSLATEWLVPSLHDFYRRHPTINVFVRAEFVDPSAARLEADGIDIMIAYQRGECPSLSELGKIEEFIAPVCSRTYRQLIEESSYPIPIVRLHDAVALLGGKAQLEWEMWEAANPTWTHPVAAERHFNQAHLAYHDAISDKGIAMGRALLIGRLLSRGDIVPASDLPPIPAATYRILALRPGGSSSPVHAFVAWLRSAMVQASQQVLDALPDRASA